MHAETEINAIIQGHFTMMEEERELFQNIRAAANHKLWGSGGTVSPLSFWMNRGRGDHKIDPQKLPVRRQVNTVRPFLNRTKSMLYQRAPRVTVTRPKVRATRRGKKLTAEMAEALSEVATEFVRQADLRATMENALEQAIAMPGCALRVWFDPDGATPMEKIKVCAIPRWYAGWDELADLPGTERYRFHIRQERAVDVKTLCPDFEVKGTTANIQDWLVDGHTEMRDPNRADGYVQVVEWWDLEANEVQHFVLRSNKVDCCGSKPFPIPYKWPDGTPIVQIVPIILEWSPGLPKRPVSLVMPSFEETCEKSIVLSIVLSAFRRDAARTILYLKGKGVSDPVIAQITSGFDLEFVGIDGDTENPIELSAMFKALDLPDLSATLDKAQQYLSLAASDSSSVSALGRGQTAGFEYASGTAASAVTSGDAAAVSLPAERMAAYLQHVVSAAFVMLGTKGVGLHVDMALDEVSIPPEVLRQPLTVKIEDAAAEAAKKDQVKASLVQALPMYVQAVAIASTGIDPATGQPVPEPIRIAAEREVDLFVETYGWPERMRWSALQKKKPDVEAKPPPEPEVPDAPMAPQAAPPVEAVPAGPPVEPSGAPVDPRAEAMAAALSPEELDELIRMAQAGEL